MLARIQITNNILFDFALKIPFITTIGRGITSLVPKVAKSGYKYGAKTASVGALISIAQWAYVMAVLAGDESEEEREKSIEQLLREGPFPLVNLWSLLTTGEVEKSAGIFFKPAEWTVYFFQSMFKEDVRKRPRRQRKLR